MANQNKQTASRSIVVNLISANGIKKGMLFGKQHPTAQIRVTGASVPQVTTMVSGGSTSPVWNHEFVFSVEDSSLVTTSASVSILIYPKLNLTGKLLGTVNISLVPSMRKVGEAQYGAFPVLQINGKAKGLLNASVTVLGNPFTEEQLNLVSKPVNHYPTYATGMASTGPGYGYSHGAPAGPGYGYSHGAPPYPVMAPGPSYHHYPPVYADSYGHNHHGRGRMGGMGGMGGMGAGLLIGGVGGLLVADAIMDF